MDPLNDMYNALVSINNILQKRKQKSEENFLDSIQIEKSEIIKDSILSSDINNLNLQTSIIMNKTQNNPLHFQPLTEENFYHAHLFNRNIDELPNISAIDINQFKLINIYRIQDLLGRYLIHDTSKQFQNFLIKNFQFNRKTALFITDLFDQWTKYNIDGIIKNETNN